MYYLVSGNPKKSKDKTAFGYYSPTDMGIGNTKAGIINEEICEKAAIKEIYRRKDFYEKEFKSGRENRKTLERMDEIIRNVN